MVNQLISPNWHVILLHYPLALVGLGILIELGSFMWRKSSAHTAGRWMLLLGILSCIPASASGLFAYRQVIYPPLVADTDLNQTFEQLKATSPAASGAPQYAWMFEHLKWELIGTGILVFTLLFYMGGSDKWRRLLYLPLLILLLAGFTALVSGAWHSGEAVYQYGLATGEKHTPHLTQSALYTLHNRLQLHVVAAGWAVALGIVALAASIRALHEGAPEGVTDQDWVEAEPVTGVRVEEGVDSHGRRIALEEIDPTTNRPIVVTAPIGVVKHPIATSRWWLLLTLVGIATAAGGLWLLLPDVHKWNVPTLQAILLKPTATAALRDNRNLWHSIFGTSIILLSLILALTSRVARRNQWVLMFFGLLMLAALAGQIWLGTLLMYDTAKGPDREFWKPNRTMPTTSPTATPGVAIAK